MKRSLLSIAGLTLLLCLLDRFYRVLHLEVNLVRAGLVGLTALAVLAPLSRKYRAAVPVLPRTFVVEPFLTSALHLEINMNRRQWLTGFLALIAGALLPAFTKDKSGVSTVVKSKSEWKRLLSRDRYLVLFEEHTEPPGSSPLNHEQHDGTYICAACRRPLFDSAKKYDSGTGWPSFFEPLPDALGTRTDVTLILPRTEYHCARCRGHQGHVFADGPPPTGLRYCNNGLALEFVPKEETLPELRT